MVCQQKNPTLCESGEGFKGNQNPSIFLFLARTKNLFLKPSSCQAKGLLWKKRSHSELSFSSNLFTACSTESGFPSPNGSRLFLIISSSTIFACGVGFSRNNSTAFAIALWALISS